MQSLSQSVSKLFSSIFGMREKHNEKTVLNKGHKNVNMQSVKNQKKIKNIVWAAENK